MGEALTAIRAKNLQRLVMLESAKALVDHIVNLGKKGLAVQRYKGLGEMNPDSCGKPR